MVDIADADAVERVTAEVDATVNCAVPTPKNALSSKSIKLPLFWGPL